MNQTESTANPDSFDRDNGPRQVLFKDVPIGAEFFDPDCGEDFRKVSATQAEMLGPMFGDGSLDTFGADELVEVTT